MSDAQRRALRSLFQVGVVQAVISLWNAFALTPLTSEQATAITLVATPLLVFGQNFLEDTTSFPALLKAPTSPGVNPVPDPEGARLEHPKVD